MDIISNSTNTTSDLDQINSKTGLVSQECANGPSIISSEMMGQVNPTLTVTEDEHLLGSNDNCSRRRHADDQNMADQNHTDRNHTARLTPSFSDERLERPRSRMSRTNSPCRHRNDRNTEEECRTEHLNTEEADELRRALRYFFMNPCEKYKAKRVFPWKLGLQIVKIILVTIQLIIFGTSRSSHIDFLETTNIAFKHLYLKDWSASFEIMPYPPSVGTFAVYTIADFFSSVDHTLKQYNITEDLAIGSFDFTDLNDSMVPVEMCKTHYKEGYIWAYNESFVFDSSHERVCFSLRPVWDAESSTWMYDARRYLDQINQTIDFDRLITMELNFAIKTIHLKTKTKFRSPDCYRFNITVLYDNSQHNGQVVVSLSSKENTLQCHGKVLYQSDLVLEALLLTLFDSIVICISIFSFVLCARSLYRAHKLKQKSLSWFAKTYPKNPLTNEELIEFINMWYILIIINDSLTTAGSIVKILIENNLSNGYEVCGVFLSSANLLVWVGVLRYLGFFEKYNVLLLTMKCAAPSVLRFLVCAALIYLGFAICGWIVLGPYHVKFRQLSTSSECLFSLINGDDIFTTFAAMEVPNSVLWWYSRVYLYSFVSLFIYVILSVFISVIMDTYDTIKHYCTHGYPKSRLMKFADECQEEPEDLFRSGVKRGCAPSCWVWLCRLCLPQRNLTVRCDEDDCTTGDYHRVNS